MLAKRIIPCLDVKEGRVVKGVNFVDLVDAGDPVKQARFYEEEGADELVFLDITASAEKRKTMVELASRTADQVFMPFTIGGGITTLKEIRNILKAGADKISLNTAAVLDPELVERAAARFGSQCVVVAIDAKRKTEDGRRKTEDRRPKTEDGRRKTEDRRPGRGEISYPTSDLRLRTSDLGPPTSDLSLPTSDLRPPTSDIGIPTSDICFPTWEVYIHGGRTATGRDAVTWAREAAERGAGEILLTSMDGDGTLDGYDLELTRAVAAAVNIPVIASGGAGKLEHLFQALTEGRAQAVLAASIFHFRTFSIRQAKEYLREKGVAVRI